MPRSPLRDGWRVLMRAPSVVIAEITWRWTFGVAMFAILYYSFREYFASVEISRAEYSLLRSLAPATWIAITARVVVAFVTGIHVIGPIIIPAIAILWIALATIGRAATVRALIEGEPNTNWVASAALNIFRVILASAAVLAFFGCGILVNVILGDTTQLVAEAFILMLLAMIVIGTTWGMANWFFSLAPIFAAKDGLGFWSSLGQAARLYRSHRVAFFSTGFWFSLARSIFIVATTFLSFWAFQSARPHLAIALIIVISIGYFALADALNMWRLATYISLTEPEPAPPVMSPEPVPSVVLPSEPSTAAEPPLDPPAPYPIAESQ